MDRRSYIEARLRDVLVASHVDVADESHLHAGHAGAASGGGHFRATIVSQRFAGLSRVARQRLVYGAIAFPLQVTIQLSEPGVDFDGGEFLLVEQRPRQQSRGSAVALAQGEAIVFATRERPVDGSRGVYRAALRHGVSPLRTGARTTLGIIFHDAK